MIKVKQSGDFSRTEAFLKRMRHPFYFGMLHKYGKQGVEALRAATPRDTGKTAESWGYEIRTSGDRIKIIWKNSNLAERGMPVAVLIQYGHATKNGGYVQGIDYINPALQPIFQEMADSIWKEVTK